MATTIGAVQAVLGFDIRQFVAGEKQAETGMGRMSSKAQKVQVDFGRLGDAIIGAISINAIRRIANMGANLDSLQQTLRVVDGSTAAANAQLERLLQISKAPGIDFAGAVQGAANLQLLGFSASTSEKALKEFANAVALTGGGRAELSRVFLQLQQIASAGKILQQDLRPIIQTAPAVGKALLAAFGTISPEAINKLGLSSQQFVERLLDAMSQLERAPSTAKTSFENFAAASELALGRVGQELNRVLVPALDSITRLLYGFDPSGMIRLATEAAKATTIVLGLAGAFKVLTVAMVTFRGANAVGAFLALVPAITSVADAVALLSVAFKGLLAFLGPGGLLVVAIGAVTAALHLMSKAHRDAAKAASDMRKAATDAATAVVLANEKQAKAAQDAAKAQIEALNAQRKALEQQQAAANQMHPVLSPTGTTISTGRNQAEVERLGKAIQAVDLELAKQGGIFSAASTALQAYRTAADAAGDATGSLGDAALKLADGLKLQIAQTRELIAAQGQGGSAISDVARKYEELDAIAKIRAQFTGKEAAQLIALVHEYYAAKDALDALTKATDEANRRDTDRLRIMDRMVNAAQSLARVQVRTVAPTVKAPAGGMREWEKDLVTASQEAAKAVDAIWEEAAKGIQRSLAAGFETIFRDGPKGFQTMAHQVLDIMLNLAAQIAAAFTAEKLGITELIAKIRKAQEEGSNIKLTTGQSIVGAGLVGVGAGSVGGPVAGAVGGAAAGAAMGNPYAAIIGGVAGFVSGLISSGKKAQEAAHQMALAQAAWQRSLDAFVAGAMDVTGIDKSISALRDKISGMLESFNQAFGANVTMPSTRDLDAMVAQLDFAGKWGAAFNHWSKEEQDAYNAFVEATRVYVERLKEEIKKAQKAFQDDLEVRRLEATGAADAAAALRQQLADQKEIDDAIASGFDDATIAMLKHVQALEAEKRAVDAAAAAAKAAADAAQKRAAFESDIQARLATLRGDDMEALRIRLEAQNAAELAAAQALLDAGTITQDMFTRLADLLGKELAKALQDAADAAVKAAEAQQQVNDAFDKSLQVRQLELEGRDREAQILQKQIEQAKELADAIAQGVPQDLLDKLKAIQKQELDKFIASLDAAGQTTGAALDAARSAANVASEVAKGAQSITASQAQVLVSLQRNAVNFLAAIEANTRPLRGDGVGVFTGMAQSRPAVTFAVSVTINGDVYADDAMQTGRTIGRGIADAVNRELGDKVAQSQSYSGIATVG